jgi:putative membrane protein
MISYNPKDWLRLIFQFHKSDTFRILLPTMTLLGAITGILAWLEVSEHIQFQATTVFHQILGFALSMLLVFRINTAYDRWWEGRRLWGSLVNNSRSLAAKLSAMLCAQAPQELSSIGSALAAFPGALRDHLRDIKDGFDEEHLRGLDTARFHQARHQPIYLHNEIVRRLETLRAKGTISDEQILSINAEVFSLIDITGACERIKNSPIPFSYSLFLKKSLFVYSITMPIPFSVEFGYWGILAVMVIFYTFASLEIVSEEVEEPFGTEANDLPTDELAEKIFQDVKALCQCDTTC